MANEVILDDLDHKLAAAFAAMMTSVAHTRVSTKFGSIQWPWLVP
jgi:hypothetical protein